ncbi:transposase [Streptomyces sp. BK022]|uniref:IS701 family transposase n=1 Tax=Streptomyces sp. BK022 TaxID=2512123 RepID=UPI001F5F018B|nr:transposase [Streptomyces sp. BK022]
MIKARSSLPNLPTYIKNEPSEARSGPGRFHESPSGTAGRTENCQVGVFAAYATTRGHALVDRELYLPKSWTEDRERCRAARIPDERTFATKGDLARYMISRAQTSPLPIAWVTADSAYGQDSHFRRFLEDARLPYIVAVPKSQQVHGRRIDHLIVQAPPDAWQRLSAGPGVRANGSTTGPPPTCRP